jgi:hypothetical protein
MKVEMANLLFTLLGVILSVSALPIYEWYRTRRIRKLRGLWMSACQAVYYEDEAWHIQQMEIRWSLLGTIIDAVEEKGKLPWVCITRLVGTSLLVGKWHSKRPGSTSAGYLALEIAENGRYMWGHLYGKPSSNRNALYSHFILARTEDDLEVARSALENSRRGLPKLGVTKNYV